MMPKFMVVYGDGQNTFTQFSDTFSEAQCIKDAAECGLGMYVEVYERTDSIHPEYRFLFS